MKIRKAEILTLLLVIGAFILGASFYNILPAKIASHWNIQGQVDGYMTKAWGVFFLPATILILWLLFLVIPRVDPKKENIQKFRKYFDSFIILLFLALLYIYFLVIFWNLGRYFNLIRFLVPVFGILFYYMGILISHAQPNWSIGIRTPWTLNNNVVWQKTHRLGGWLLRGCGILAILGLLWPAMAFSLAVGPIIISLIITFTYSYLLYRTLNTQSNRQKNDA